jgi:hypothetical protein
LLYADWVKTNYYVDGFNLFHRALRGSPYLWLDLEALFRRTFPNNPIHRIRYFTSHVSGIADRDKPVRQQLYLRALATTPNLSVQYGKFHKNKVFRRLVAPSADGTETVRVWDTKEKGSDVSLATMLVVDACDNDFEAAVVVTNDSDLLLSIGLVATQFAKPVGILNPAQSRSKALAKTASFHRQLRASDLAACQFPETMTDEKGTFRRPRLWAPTRDQAPSAPVESDRSG